MRDGIEVGKSPLEILPVFKKLQSKRVVRFGKIGIEW